MDGADNLLGGGIDGLEGLAVDALDPFVVDEPVGMSCQLGPLPEPSRKCGVDGVSTYNPVGCSYLPVDGVWSEAVRLILMCDCEWTEYNGYYFGVVVRGGVVCGRRSEARERGRG